ncbi:MAG: radical SAM protein [Planctomycetota bacterium]|jgi:uncharacterized protein
MKILPDRNCVESPRVTEDVISLPGDCVFLPLSSGKLLVSRSHAVFCRVPSGEVGILESVVSGDSSIDAIDSELWTELERHGFFGPSRGAKSDKPTVQLQLTNDCNLACGYCCTNSGRPRAREVGYEEMLAVAKQIPDVLGPDTGVAILGGEPLLVPWALDLAAEINSMGLKLTIFTNGIPLTNDALAKRTAELSGKGVEIRVSLGGPTSDTCDILSGTERFEAAIRGVKRLADFGRQAIVDVMLVPQHVNEIARELPSLRKRLPEETQITFGVLYMSGRESGEHLFESRAEIEKALDLISFEAGEIIKAPETSPLTHRREGCGCALGNHIHVRSDGDLFNCFKMEEKVGELKTTGFAEAARLIRENPHRAAELPTCADCPLATICGAGCRSENLLYTGDPDKPPCGLWRVRVLSELLAEGRVTALEWPVAFLLHEARRRGIETPENLAPQKVSRHMIDV